MEKFDDCAVPVLQIRHGFVSAVESFDTFVIELAGTCNSFLHVTVSFLSRGK